MRLCQEVYWLKRLRLVHRARDATEEIHRYLEHIKDRKRALNRLIQVKVLFRISCHIIEEVVEWFKRCPEGGVSLRICLVERWVVAPDIFGIELANTDEEMSDRLHHLLASVWERGHHASLDELRGKVKLEGCYWPGGCRSLENGYRFEHYLSI